MPTKTLFSFLDTIKALAEKLNYEQPLQAQLSIVLELLATQHGFLRPHIVLFEPETGFLKLKIAQDAPRKNHEEYTSGKGVTGQVFATAKSAIVPIMSQDPTFSSLLFERSQDELDSLAFICVPIFAHAQESTTSFLPRDVIGTLGIDSPSNSQEDLELRCKFLEVVADFISLQVAYLQNISQQNILQSQQSVELSGGNITFVAKSKKMKLLLEHANTFSQSNLPVLIYGEKGTGKEYYARYIHANGKKRSLPFHVYSADSIRDDIDNYDEIEKTFCGYVKNAFPSALQTTKGIFESTAQGTLYIESVEKLPPIAQKILLKVLTEGTITRLGSETPIPLHVHIIASTKTSLEEQVKKGLFDEELALRLNFQHTTIPPLRERGEDILPLAEFFLKEEAIKNNSDEVKRISYPAMEVISSYYYSKNIPELKAIIDYAITHCEDTIIRTADLPPSIQTANKNSYENEISLTDAVNNFEKELLADALVKANGNMFKAAQDLKTSYRIINYKVKKYNLNAKKSK